MQAASGAHSVRFIFNTALWVTAVGVLVRGAGAIKEIVFAGAYGVSGETDAFVLAVTYATFPPTVLGGAIATALVAHLANGRSESSKSEPQVAYLASIGIAGLVCGCALYLLAPVGIPALFTIETSRLAHAVRYAQILSPLGAVMVWAAALAACLNSAKQFYVPAISAFATPVAMLVFIAAFGTSWGIAAAAWGLLVGAVAELALLAARLQMQRFGGDFVRSGATAFWRSVAVLSLAGAVSTVATLVDQVFLSKLPTGAITQFSYAYKVNSLLVALFGNAFCIVIYPYLSDLAAAHNAAALKRLALKLASIVVPATGAVSLAIYLFSDDIVKLLFLRGNFSEEAALRVSAIQQVFAFQLVFYVGGLLTTRVLNATRSTEMILWIACIGVGAVALFDWQLYQPLGARGIALSAVITSFITLAAGLFFARAALVRNAR